MDRGLEKIPPNASRLIAMAVSLVGSAAEVVAEMKSTDADFRAYCAAEKEPSAEEFSRLVTLIIREQGKLIAKNRELLATIRERKSTKGT
jgi:hypothetical protein